MCLKFKVLTMRIIILLLLSLSSLQAQVFHAILVGDTTDEFVGTSVRQDLKLMDQKLLELSLELKTPFQRTLIVGKLVTPRYILATLEELEIEEGDIVFFYFSGHGYRTESKQSPLPNLLCSSAGQGFDLGDVIDLIDGKNPRLKLFVADVCNNVLPEDKAPILISSKQQARSLFHPKGNQNLVKLFLETAGTIIVASSHAGELAYCTERGGFFTSSLIKSIEKAASTSKATWEDLLQEAYDDTGKKTDGAQHPDFLLSIG